MKEHTYCHFKIVPQIQFSAHEWNARQKIDWFVFNMKIFYLLNKALNESLETKIDFWKFASLVSTNPIRMFNRNDLIIILISVYSLEFSPIQSKKEKTIWLELILSRSPLSLFQCFFLVQSIAQTHTLDLRVERIHFRQWSWILSYYGNVVILLETSKNK